MNDAKQIIELGLGSIGKIRIMRALAEENKMATIYLLHKKTRLKRDHIKTNLDDLIRIGWVTRRVAPNPMYAFNHENPYASRLIEFFKETGYIGQP